MDDTLKPPMLTAPEPVAAVPVAEAIGKVPVPADERAKLDDDATRIARELAQLSPDSDAYKERVRTLESLANAEITRFFREWLETFSGYVRDVDYASARPLFHPDVLAFGTHNDVIPGVEQWVARFNDMSSREDIPYALAVGTYADGGVAWPFIASLTTIYIIPPVVFIYAFQKYLLVGMTFGTVRGEV